MALLDPTLRVVLLEDDAAPPLSASERFQAVHTLLQNGYRVDCPRTATVAPPTLPTLLTGRTASAPASTSADPAGTTSPTARWHAWGQEGVEGVLRAAQSAQSRAKAPEPGAWLPWFPVIDYDRCTNCMQCLSFCLFGVYGVDARGAIQAQHQDQCKTNCPACSRVCPEAAIMFPKYKAGPINGDSVSNSDLQREKMKIDISALLGGDVYSLLRDRSERARSRFGKERDSDKALAERQKCLNKLGAIMADVPPEVLASLPSPEEIARKAEETRVRAAQARAQFPPSADPGASPA
ncbi:MAG: ferredoxin family protein [Verrucomicrobiales bacterium]|nr:ferredoxin family protein [Verrucomicrobiales bacterium]